MEAQIEKTLGGELHQACEDGSLDDVRRIISRQEASDPSFKVPFPEMLYTALGTDKLRTVQFCLEHGATVTDDKLGKILICLPRDSYTYLLESHVLDVNQYVPWWGDILSVVAQDNDLEWAKFCLEHAADPNKNLVDRYKSLLAATAQHASLEIVTLLVEHGARVKGSGALIMAAEKGKLAMVDYLLAHGADIDEIGIEHPFDERYKNDAGSALHRAAHSGHADVIDFLINKGAQRDLKDMLGRTPMDLARAKGNDVIEKMLEKYDTRRHEQA